MIISIIIHATMITGNITRNSIIEEVPPKKAAYRCRSNPRDDD